MNVFELQSTVKRQRNNKRKISFDAVYSISASKVFLLRSRKVGARFFLLKGIGVSLLQVQRPSLKIGPLLQSLLY